jgi:hypothetical protein
MGGSKMRRDGEERIFIKNTVFGIFRRACYF